jgi:hypothetical protein
VEFGRCLGFYCDIRSSKFCQLCLLSVENCISCDAQYLELGKVLCAGFYVKNIFERHAM